MWCDSAGAWRATVHGVTKELNTTWWLNNQPYPATRRKVSYVPASHSLLSSSQAWQRPQRAWVWKVMGKPHMGVRSFHPLVQEGKRGAPFSQEPEASTGLRRQSCSYPALPLPPPGRTMCCGFRSRSTSTLTLSAAVPWRKDQFQRPGPRSTGDCRVQWCMLIKQQIWPSSGPSPTCKESTSYLAITMTPRGLHKWPSLCHFTPNQKQPESKTRLLRGQRWIWDMQDQTDPGEVPSSLLLRAGPSALTWPLDWEVPRLQCREEGRGCWAGSWAGSVEEEPTMEVPGCPAGRVSLEPWGSQRKSSKKQCLKLRFLLRVHLPCSSPAPHLSPAPRPHCTPPCGLRSSPVLCTCCPAKWLLTALGSPKGGSSSVLSLFLEPAASSWYRPRAGTTPGEADRVER